MEKILEKLRQKENLTFEESKSSFELLMTGKSQRR
jgi:anthranilate phosphoribosyltransferase